MADSLTDESTVPKAVERGRDMLETFAGRHYQGAPRPLEVESGSVRTDLLADLMHEAESANENVSTLIERARIHYEAESGDTPHENTRRSSDSDALDRIAEQLDGSEWSADDCEAVAGLVRDTGREIREVDDLPDED
jgi:hypothetical protein